MMSHRLLQLLEFTLCDSMGVKANAAAAFSVCSRLLIQLTTFG